MAELVTFFICYLAQQGCKNTFNGIHMHYILRYKGQSDIKKYHVKIFKTDNHIFTVQLLVTAIILKLYIEIFFSLTTGGSLYNLCVWLQYS